VSRNDFFDPWGRQYRIEAIPNERAMKIISAGQDGRFGTEDDLELKFF
jgi:hypothetical protein